jgi:phosphotransferase system IIB component
LLPKLFVAIIFGFDISTELLIRIIGFTIVLVFGVIAIIYFSRKNGKIKTKNKSVDSTMENLVSNLGGYENLISASILGSRTKFKTVDIKLCHFDKLKENFESGIFVTGNSITILCGFDTTEIVERINSIKKGD